MRDSRDNEMFHLAGKTDKSGQRIRNVTILIIQTVKTISGISTLTTRLISIVSTPHVSVAVIVFVY